MRNMSDRELKGARRRKREQEKMVAFARIEATARRLGVTMFVRGANGIALAPGLAIEATIMAAIATTWNEGYDAGMGDDQ